MSGDACVFGKKTEIVLEDGTRRACPVKMVIIAHFKNDVGFLICK